MVRAMVKEALLINLSSWLVLRVLLGYVCTIVPLWWNNLVMILSAYYCRPLRNRWFGKRRYRRVEEDWKCWFQTCLWYVVSSILFISYLDYQLTSLGVIGIAAWKKNNRWRNSQRRSGKIHNVIYCLCNRKIKALSEYVNFGFLQLVKLVMVFLP